MIHDLKIEDRWLRRISAHEKTAEVRYDDRDYQAGDLLRLSVRPGPYWMTLERRVTHVLREVDGLAPGYVILSLADPRVADLRERAERAEKSNAPLRGTITRLTRELKEARDASR